MARQQQLGAGVGRGVAACARGRALDHGHAPGFTLLEMLAALAIVAVLVLVAAPSWSSWQQRRQLQAQSEAMLGSLALARAQALMQQQRVTLCPSRQGETCDAGGAVPAASEGTWQVGWIVFVDGNRNGLREADEPLLQQHAASPKGVRMVSRNTLSQAIAYGVHGGSEGVQGQFLAGTLQLCAEGQQEGWQIVLNPLGRARLAKVALASCP